MSTTMGATSTLYQNDLQSNLLDNHALVDQNQYMNMSTFFCRALYDYQSRDASSLSFHKGDIIEVLTQLDSGWWDGLLHDERGWFPSNYVAPVSFQEVEDELKSTRAEPQNGDWIQDERTESTGPSSDFWVPQVTSDSQIFYVNTQTGERSNELPTEADSDPEPLPTNAYTPPTSTAAYSSSFARSSSTAPLESPIAGFGLPKRSGTPEPWVKRLADDGMSYYYLNTIDGSIRWTAPSPQLDHRRAPVQDPPDGRDRADSAATRDRLSVYSDSSDVNPLGILGHVALHGHPGSIATATPNQQDDDPDMIAARDLQSTLRDRFAHPPESLDELAQTARIAITDLLDVALTRSPDIPVRDAIKRTMDAIRNLIYASATLPGPLTSLPEPYTSDAASSDIAELKPFHRKVTATMVKLVSTVRASESEASIDEDAPARLEADAVELERAIAVFVNEVLSRRPSHQSSRRVRAILLSADGPKGVGIGLLGAGAGGYWKGFGFVQPLADEYLSPESIVTTKHYKSRLGDALTDLEVPLAEGHAPAVVFLGREAIRHIVSFLEFVAKINVAGSIDVDSSSVTVTDQSYVQSVTRARALVRSLEGCVQAVFDDGAVLLHASQSVSAKLSAQDENSPWETLLSAIPALRRNVDDVCSTIEALTELAQFQADTCAKAGLDASIGTRQATLRIEDDGSPDIRDFGPGIGARDILRPDTATEYELGHLPARSDEEEMVNLGDVLGPRHRDRDTAMFGMTGHGQSDTSIDRLYKTARAGTRERRESTGSMDRERPSTGTSYDVPKSQTSTLIGDESPPLAEEEDDDDLDIAFTSKSPPKAHKIKKILGADAPEAYIKMANADSKPWYLRAEYGAKDIFINPDGGVRGGTLPALIERLTMHDNRDTGFNNTFLVTFKSFTTLDEIFDSLVKRFYIQAPPNLSPDELKEWTEQKRVVVRFRVINILKSIMDDDVLEKEDVHILDRIKAFATTVEKEVTPPIPAAKQLLVLVDRAQSGGDAMKKMTLLAPNFPPASIVPRTNKPMKLLDIDPLELARQLTIMESKLFAKIRPMECLNRGRDGKPGDSDDNISAIIDTSNKVAEWVADAVLSRDDSRKRAAIVKQFIAVADRCRHLQNFSTMAALVAGLNSPPIRRLKRTWEQVNARSKTQLQEAERTMDTNKNFTNYRAILKGAQLPCVPFFGVYLSVLTFIQDGNKDMLQGQIINFSKREKFAEVIREIKHYQSKPYNLTTIPSIQNYIDEALSALGNTADLSDRAWNLSLEREPREREDEKMARLLQESGFL